MLHGHGVGTSASSAARRALAALAVGIVVLGAAPAWAAEIELRNDSLAEGGSGAIQAGFVAGEIGAAVFNPDPSLFPMQVTRVQIFWRSFFGGQPDTLGRAIKFYQGGSPAPPPVQVFSLDGPVLTDGFLNEFDVTPFNINFSSGPFAIGFQFDTSPTIFDPSLVTDTDGCQNGKNLLFAVPGGWSNGCSLGISGDFVIRCFVETGAIGPDTECRAGNVDTGSGGDPKDVLKLDNSVGSPLLREMTVPAGNHTISIVKPPAGGSGLYAFWVLDGKPNAGTVTQANAFNGAGGVQSLGMACRCLPSNNHVSPGACPCPSTFPQGFTSKTIAGAGAAANVCLHRAPRDPFAPTSFVRSFPAGDYTILGIIFDPNSSAPGPRDISLTNAIVVTVTP